MRINLIGGPGSGKSTTAAAIFSELKRRNISVELVNEYVKTWTYTGRKPFEFDQVLLFGKQMDAEHVYLANGVKNIVTDSPTLLSAVYAEVYCNHLNIHKHIDAINDEYEKRHPGCYIFLNRGNKQYNQAGRYQTYEQAKDVDELIKKKMYNLLAEGKISNYHELDYQDFNKIMNTVLDNITK